MYTTYFYGKSKRAHDCNRFSPFSVSQLCTCSQRKSMPRRTLATYHVYKCLYLVRGSYAQIQYVLHKQSPGATERPTTWLLNPSTPFKNLVTTAVLRKPKDVSKRTRRLLPYIHYRRASRPSLPVAKRNPRDKFDPSPLSSPPPLKMYVKRGKEDIMSRRSSTELPSSTTSTWHTRTWSTLASPDG